MNQGTGSRFVSINGVTIRKSTRKTKSGNKLMATLPQSTGVNSELSIGAAVEIQTEQAVVDMETESAPGTSTSSADTDTLHPDNILRQGAEGFTFPNLDEGRVDAMGVKFPEMANEYRLLSLNPSLVTLERFRDFMALSQDGWKYFCELYRERKTNGPLANPALPTATAAETRKDDYSRLSDHNTSSLLNALKDRGENIEHTNNAINAEGSLVNTNPVDSDTMIKSLVTKYIDTELCKRGLRPLGRDISLDSEKRDCDAVRVLASLASRGLANHVKKCDVETILANKYINFELLVPLSYTESSRFKDKLSWDLDDEGRPIATQVRPSKKIFSFEQWSLAYNVFKAIYQVGFPDQQLGLLKHEEVIRAAATTHRIEGSMGWLDYDIAWRKNKEILPDTPWGVIDQDMWCLHVMKPPKKDHNIPALVKGGRVTKNKKGAARKSASLALGPTCNFYNRETGCYRRSCRFSHACSHCRRLNHPAFKCFSRQQNTKPVDSAPPRISNK